MRAYVEAATDDDSITYVHPEAFIDGLGLGAAGLSELPIGAARARAEGLTRITRDWVVGGIRASGRLPDDGGRRRAARTEDRSSHARGRALSKGRMETVES